jgi:hypothetical protein
MAITSYTTNLKLRIEDNMSTTAIYNLQRIDELGGVFALDETSATSVSSSQDVLIRPNNPAAGGSGEGGNVYIGIRSQVADLVEFNSKLVQFPNTDTINFGTAKLTGSFKIPWTNIDTSLGTVASFPDFQAAVANVPAIVATVNHPSRSDNPHSTTAAQVGAYSISQVDSALAVKANLSLVQAHLNANSGVHGLVGQVVGTTDSQTLVNKYLDASSNQLRNISDISIAENAQIAGTKVSPNFGSQDLSTSGQVKLTGPYTYFSTIRASRAQQTANLVFSLPSSYGVSGQVLSTDGQGNLSWQAAGGSGNIVQELYLWTHADGLEKVITHSFNNQNLDITIKDLESNELIFVPDLNIIDNSTIHMISSEAPATAWQVIIQGVAR